jgi:hypothetical protein
MSDVKFIRVNGRVIPIRDAGPKRDSVLAGAGRGAMNGVVAGATIGGALGVRRVNKQLKMASARNPKTDMNFVKTANNLGRQYGPKKAVRAMRFGGAVGGGLASVVDGAILGAGVGAIHTSHKNRKRKRDFDDQYRHVAKKDY